MYPSDQVWKGIHKSLHGRKRWRWAGLAVLLLGIGLYTANWYFYNNPAKQIANNIQSSLNAANNIPGQTAINNIDRSSYVARQTNTTSTTRQGITPGSNTGNTGAQSAGSDEPISISADEFTGITSFNNELPLVIHSNPANISDLNTDPHVAKDKATEQAASTVVKTDNNLADAASESALNLEKNAGVNWLQEYALYQLKTSKRKKLGVQLYFSPTVNYRKLSGSSYFPSSEVKSIPLKLNVMGDVDQYVKHKPALGFEIGGNLLYRTSKAITFRAGLQFNYSRYTIQAYTAQPELATIALNTMPYVADTISTYSNIRNLSGYAQKDLSNQYFQLSMPIGVELRLLGTDKLQLNVAGTIQPTYLLNRNSYLITTDYKNYMREPSLVRRWNVNTGLEAYVSYNTGTVRWQVGPQFRYQLLSSYSRKYPIKEHLMEYGFKIGVSKTIQ